ncbi:MAG: hypothetical protein EOO42_04570 [Flavobacteriales bacterium]|nr:MAG: hypothetical protein EOO42_04570 [Flavobacteriales bacterium]
MRKQILILSLILTAFFASCSKDEEVNVDLNAVLNFSKDSVLFDTVFTSVGSTNRRLKIFNGNEKAININNVRLAGGATSAFSLNINGIASTETSNLKINGTDSINLFVKVNINPTNENLPFIVQDSILFYYNGKKQSIPLVAYGQNAIFVNGETIKENTVWDSRLPYIVYKSVTVAKDAQLTINAGTRILFHGNSTMSIKGTLIANGTKKDSIVFASDRLEKMYQDESGQWNGLHFYPESKNSQINYAILKNAVAGITVDSLSVNKNPKLLLSNSLIKNMQVVGFLGYQTELSAFNNLFYNCGQYLLYGVGGGKYNLKHNTFAGFNIDFVRRTPAVYFSDFISTTQASNLNLQIANNIIWGTLADEFVIEKKDLQTTVTSDIKNNLLKTNQGNLADAGNIFNTDPQFVDATKQNFNLSKTSIAQNKGLNLVNDPYFSDILKKDLNGKTRIFPYELGCYENK